MTNYAVHLISRFVVARHPTAITAILAGSRARGAASFASDYDVILLFDTLPNGAWREMTMFEGQHVEVFAHDLGTLAYFCRAVDRPSGIPTLPAMIAEGVVVLARSESALKAAQALATKTLASWPPPLDTNAIRARRFAISELASSLQPDRDRHVLLAAGTALYAALADFALTWGKPMGRFGKGASWRAERLGPGSCDPVRSGLHRPVRHE
jgi:hypothetical protein